MVLKYKWKQEKWECCQKRLPELFKEFFFVTQEMPFFFPVEEGKYFLTYSVFNIGLVVQNKHFVTFWRFKNCYFKIQVPLDTKLFISLDLLSCYFDLFPEFNVSFVSLCVLTFCRSPRWFLWAAEDWALLHSPWAPRRHEAPRFRQHSQRAGCTVSSEAGETRGTHRGSKGGVEFLGSDASAGEVLPCRRPIFSWA